MADLFELSQLASYMQQDLDQASAELARTVATSLIRSAAGAARYDALVDLSPLLPVALDVARRILLNPAGVRSEQIDDYSVTYAAEVLAGAALTDDERARVLAAVGVRTSTAFSIRPGAPARRRCWRYGEEAER
ncbi:hypothetical protein [Micromonospora rubida]|uniref:hypothetical protein n=1 Tax=Micromonospora rubida TaxID=2697657 RepID=UPI0013778B7E|nr:hypothetical protein [Micromonospora rubida]NBE80317.1 hypothetical protein [Micromonospora rubida]